MASYSGSMAKPAEVIAFIGRNSKRVAISIVGGLLVLAGLAMVVLPGPGILVVALGFAVLGTEYAWAAQALERTKRTATDAGRSARRVADGAVRSVRRKN
jgi:hypothetical protein